MQETSLEYSSSRRLWLARFWVQDEGIGATPTFRHVIDVDSVIVDDPMKVGAEVLA